METMEGELETLSPTRLSCVSSKGDGRGFGSTTRVSLLETLMDSPASCVSGGRGNGSGSVLSPPTVASSLEMQLKSPSSCISDSRSGGSGFSSPRRASPRDTRRNSSSSCVSDNCGGGSSSSLRVLKECERKMWEAELLEIMECYNDDFLRLRDALTEIVDLRHERVLLRAETMQPSLLFAELEAGQSKQASAVALAPTPKPVQAETAFGCAPRSISIHSKGFLSQQQQPRDESKPERIRVRASLAVEDVGEKETKNKQVEFEAYRQGALKMELFTAPTCCLDSIAKSLLMDAESILSNIIGDTAETKNHMDIFLELINKISQDGLNLPNVKDILSSLCPELLPTDEFGYDGTIRNTVTMDMDGSPEEILINYLLVMAHIRFWFISRGIQIDFTCIVEYEKAVHVVPDENTFFLVIKHKHRAATLFIDAGQTWLHGGSGSKMICQFHRRGRASYITHEYTVTLPGGGQYKDIASKGAGEVLIGSQPIIEAVTALDEIDDLEDSEVRTTIEGEKLIDLDDAFGIFVLTFLEPLKFYEAFEIVCEAIANGRVTTLNIENQKVAKELKMWGKLSTDIGNNYFDVKCNLNNKQLDLARWGLEGVNTNGDVLERIFIMPRALIPRMMLASKTLLDRSPDSTWSPVDVGEGDTIPLQKLYNKIRSQIESGDRNLRHAKFIRDQERFFGNRLGGKPCVQAVNFVMRKQLPLI